jgi:hypothetical protein
VLIIAALPDPTGSDTGAETVTLINASAATVDLTIGRSPTPPAAANR